METLVPILKSEELQLLYLQQGYVVLDFNDIQLLNKLKKIVFNYEEVFEDSFYYSLLNLNTEKSLKLKEDLQAALVDVYGRFFINCTSRNESFLVKPAQFDQEMYLHQDWTFTDMQKYQMGTLWLPLQDVDQNNGCMAVLPSSQNLGNRYCSNTYQTARIPIDVFPNAKSLPLKMGQALFFNPLLFHGSFPNKHADDRIVVTAHIFEEGAKYYYFHKKNEYQAQVFQLANNDLYGQMHKFLDGELRDFHLQEEINYSHQEVLVEQLKMI